MSAKSSDGYTDRSATVLTAMSPVKYKGKNTPQTKAGQWGPMTTYRCLFESVEYPDAKVAVRLGQSTVDIIETIAEQIKANALSVTKDEKGFLQFRPKTILT